MAEIVRMTAVDATGNWPTGQLELGHHDDGRSVVIVLPNGQAASVDALQLVQAMDLLQDQGVHGVVELDPPSEPPTAPYR